MKRPQKKEYADYYHKYISLVPDGNILEIMEKQNIQFCEFLAKVPANIKVQNNQPKHLMRKLAADYLPRPILERDKQGFMFPIAYWFRTDLYPLVSQTLEKSHFVKDGWFKKEAIQNLLTEHRTNRQDHHVRLWMLLNLELWYQLYIEGVAQEALTERLQELCLPQ